MGKLIQKYTETSSFWVKFLLIFPIALLAIVYGIPQFLQSNKKKRDQTDSKDKSLGSQINKVEKESSRHEGEVSRLKKEKQDALEKSEGEDAASFHNRRKDK